MLDVLYIIEQTGACAHYRCKTPGAALETLGYKAGITDIPFTQAARDAAVLVFQRPTTNLANKEIQRAKASGQKTIVEIDDDLWHIAKNNPAWESWNRNGCHAMKQLNEALRAVDMVTVTTDALAELVSVYNRNVVVLPNMLPDSVWSPRSRVYPENGIVIGWAGSATHADDLRLLDGIAETILGKYPNVEFHIAGMPHHFDHPRIIQLDPVPITEYPALLDTFDIGLAPVQDTLFNRCKSDLKFLELAAVGVPCVASDTMTYKTILSKWNGYVAKNAKGWIRSLSTLIESKSTYELISGNASLYAEERMATKNAHLWAEAYGLQR